jgi:hypothetical protein
MGKNIFFGISHLPYRKNGLSKKRDLNANEMLYKTN